MKKEIFDKLQDTKFMEKLMQSADINSVKEVFENENIDVSDDDVKELGKVIMMAVKKINTMDEEELEKISGGAPEKLLEFAHFPVDRTVNFINKYNNENDKEIVRCMGDMANTAIDISLWAAFIYLGYIKVLKRSTILLLTKGG